MAVKALLLSIVIVPLLLARWAAGGRDPRRGVRVTVAGALVFGALYVVALHFLYFRLQ